MFQGIRGYISVMSTLKFTYFLIRGTRWRSDWDTAPHYDPGVDSASNRNEYQVYILGVKAAGAYGWQPYHLLVPTVLKSGSLNHLETSGPVKACNGIALRLPYFLIKGIVLFF
jgi:hypothetical protein